MAGRTYSMKKDYIFNSIAGLLDALEAVIIGIVITRASNLTDAGYVTTAFAICALLLTIGKYGVYNYQISDIKHRFDFSTYFYTRIITITVMLFCLLGYLLYGVNILMYDNRKAFIILYIGLIYITEAAEDLIRAHFQSIGRLYIGDIFFIVRWFARIAVFIMIELSTQKTVFALQSACIASYIVLSICLLYTRIKHSDSIRKSKNIFNSKNVGKTLISFRIQEIFNLLATCFPLFLSTFFSFYILNSPKYAIDKYLDARDQAYYGFVAMPVFAIGMINSFIYIPQLVSLSEDYTQNKLHRFKTRILFQYTATLILTIICTTTAYIVGIPFLSFLYHTNLYDFLNELIILMISGGFLALTGYQSAVLTIMRYQKYLLWSYFPVAVIAFIFVSPVVKKYGTLGAAYSYLLLIILLSILYEVFIRKVLKKTQF